MMPKLNLPPIAPRIEANAGKLYIWDDLRQRMVRLTPEEWVRQHFIGYLIHQLGYPALLMQNEVSLRLGNTTKRADSVLYDKELRPLALIEYKRPSVPLSQAVLEQVVRYNYTMHVPLLIISNGLEHAAYLIHFASESYEALPMIPSYTELMDPSNHYTE